MIFCLPVFSDFAAKNLYYLCYAIIIFLISEGRRRAYSSKSKKVRGLTFSCVSTHRESWEILSLASSPSVWRCLHTAEMEGQIGAPLHLNLVPPFMHRRRAPVLPRRLAGTTRSVMIHSKPPPLENTLSFSPSHLPPPGPVDVYPGSTPVMRSSYQLFLILWLDGVGEWKGVFTSWRWK